MTRRYHATCHGAKTRSSIFQSDRAQTSEDELTVNRHYLRLYDRRRVLLFLETLDFFDFLTRLFIRLNAVN